MDFDFHLADEPKKDLGEALSTNPLLLFHVVMESSLRSVG
jgi:hypothetical protein